MVNTICIHSGYPNCTVERPVVMEQCSKFELLELPYEILHKILSYLSFVDLVACRLCCKLFHQVL